MGWQKVKRSRGDVKGIFRPRLESTVICLPKGMTKPRYGEMYSTHGCWDRGGSRKGQETQELKCASDVGSECDPHESCFTGEVAAIWQ